MTTDIEIVSCADLSTAQLDRLRALRVSDDQAEFGGSFGETLDGLQADNSGAAEGFCFVLGDAPIGIVVLKHAPATADWVPENAVSLHGFKIDTRWQGKGFGRRAFRLAVRAAAQRWPGAEQLVLAVDAANKTALAVYRGHGMADSGPAYSGRIGQEYRLSIPFGLSDRGPTSD